MLKKILFITPYNPANRNVGDKVYTWDLLRALRYNNTSYVHVLTYENEDNDKSKTDLEQLVNEVTYVPFKYKSRISMFFSVYPSSMANRKTLKLLKATKELLDKNSYDVVMVNMLKMTFLIDLLRGYPIKTVYISHNVEYQVSKSIYKYTNSLFYKFVYWLDYIKTFIWEKHLISKFDFVTTICDNDAEEYVKRGWCLPVVVRPIVDLLNSSCNFRPYSRKAIVCGSFTWLPKKNNLNELLNSKMINLFKKENCKLEIVGRTDKSEIDKGNKIENVFVTGPVDDVHIYYDDAAVAIVPELSGGGFKLKIAEAVQHNVPIVAIENSITDYNMKPNIHYASAKDFDQLIIKAIEIINDKNQQFFLSKNASDLFKLTYNIASVNQSILKVIM